LRQAAAPQPHIRPTGCHGAVKTILFLVEDHLVSEVPDVPAAKEDKGIEVPGGDVCRAV